MSHDTDKLIRQLSLVAFLMAERRPLTARDVKANVEGYSEMSDEAFARRFYSDRAELLALGVPLQSQRDEFTGEELYTLRSEQYFLPPLELRDDELAALQTSLYLLEGQFAYAEPLRLALQNLALGRPGLRRGADRDRRARRGARPRLLARDARPAREARGRDLEAAHGEVRLLVDLARRGGASARSTRTRSSRRTASGTSIGHDLDRKRASARSGSRASAATSASRRAASATSASRRTSTLDRVPRPRRRGRSATSAGEARIEVDPDTAWWVERAYGRAGGSRTASS